MTRWSLIFDDKTDQRMRAFLGQKGAKKRDLSKFVEEAMLDKIFVETVQVIKERNTGLDQEALMANIDEAIEAGRTGRS